jgi:succinoglycan biosynthesis transport protein ExoP
VNMLKRTPIIAAPLTASPQRAEGQDQSFNFVDIFAFVRRQWPVIVIALAGALALAIAYLLVTPAWYLGKSSLLLDTRKLQLFQQQSVLSEVSFDAPAVESQMEILKSEAVARWVVEELKLTEDPEFTGEVTSFFGSFVSAASNLIIGDGGVVPAISSARSHEESIRSAVAHLRKNLTIQRVRLTYVIEIGFTSRDPIKAVQTANAVAEAYIADQTSTKQFTTKRATAWLQERMLELREQAVASDRAAQDFRTKNNMLRVGGTSIDEQQLAHLSTQRTAAREQTAEARARLERLSEMMASRLPDAILSSSGQLSSAGQNEVMNRLRQQYVDASRREADFSVRLGPDHLAVVNVRKEMKQIEQAAANELKRVAEAYKNDFRMAQAREEAAEARLREQTRVDAETRQEQGALQVLESTAKAYQTLHDNFLQRFMEATQQQNFTTTEARVITAAVRAQKVHPKPALVLAIATMLAVMGGTAAGFARERLDNVFRTPRQVEQALGVECLGILPAIESKAVARRNKPSAVDLAQRVISEDLGLARQVILTPFSRFTETIRGIKVAVDTGQSAKNISVIGLVSAVPAEGKSTVAANLAQLTAHGGARTLLIDGDLRNPSLTRLMAPHASAGVIEALHRGISLDDLTWRDQITGLDFLPAVLTTPIAHTSELLASRAMAELVARAREEYEYVIIDFPPLAPVVDAKAGSHLVDAFMMVIEWGVTSPEIISEALGSAEIVQSKLIGVVLNRANPSALRKIEAYKGKNYHRYYTSYMSS